MSARTDRVLAIAQAKGYEVLVLGAWGCGVFQNNPEEVAACFASYLLREGKYNGVFRKIVFAVLDHSKQKRTFEAFNKVF